MHINKLLAIFVLIGVIGLTPVASSAGEMTARVQEDIDNRNALGVAGTPAAFILNPKGDARFVAGALPLQAPVDELSQ